MTKYSSNFLFFTYNHLYPLITITESCFRYQNNFKLKTLYYTHKKISYCYYLFPVFLFFALFLVCRNSFVNSIPKAELLLPTTHKQHYLRKFWDYKSCRKNGFIILGKRLLWLGYVCLLFFCFLFFCLFFFLAFCFNSIPTFMGYTGYKMFRYVGKDYGVNQFPSYPHSFIVMVIYPMTSLHEPSPTP